MKLLSVCVGEPREVVADDRLVRTSIFKSPVTGRIPIRELLRMYLNEGVASGRIREAIAIPVLSDAWRRELQKQFF